jgi:galactokinase
VSTAGPDPGTRLLGDPKPDRLVRARAPGRVNLIGDHTDYAGGWVLPMAVDLGTTIELRRHGHRLELVSRDDPQAVVVDLWRAGDSTNAGWGRYVAGVVGELNPRTGGYGLVHSDLPLGAGLSSSSSLTVALMLALGFTGTELELARSSQRAEAAGSGVPGGIMDQLCSAAGRAGHALLIDCASLQLFPVAVPEDWEVIVAHSGRSRQLVGSAYGERRAQVEAAMATVGPLRNCRVSDLSGLPPPLLRRARHVITENERVQVMAAALAAEDLAEAGRAMSESHRSLAEDFSVSCPELDDLVARLESVPGVAGARLTGAGFGGCAVALAAEGTFARWGGSAPGRWLLRAAAGADLRVLDSGPGPQR